MIAVADTYAYVDVESAHDEFVHEASAVEYLMGERGARFDPDMVDVFLKLMQPVKS